MDLTQASSQSKQAQQRAGKVPVDSDLFDERPFLKRLGVTDWLFALAMVAGAGFALYRYYPFMNYYDKLVLCAAVPTFVVLGWRWKPVRLLIACIALLSLSSLQLYPSVLARADTNFFLKYFLSSQSAILWMSALLVLATIFYWIGLLTRSATGGSIGSRMTWVAVLMGFVGLMVRWYESYLIGADVG